jgi:hypothetical protein
VSIPADLPDVETMSIEALRAEVAGGREAFDVIVEENHQFIETIAHLERMLANAHEQIRKGPCGKCLSTWGKP